MYRGKRDTEKGVHRSAEPDTNNALRRADCYTTYYVFFLHTSNHGVVESVGF